MTLTKPLMLCLLCCLGVAGPLRAQDLVASAANISAAEIDAAVAQEPASSPPPKAYEFSDAYRVRAKIHKISSFATLPLFGTEAFLGQSLYNNPTSAKKDAHLAVAAGIGTLFGINTVTGVWNLVEARKDPKGRGKRWVHGLLMLGADAGFLATAALGPGDDDRFESEGGSRSTHRAVAFTSIGVATAGYLVMLLGH